MACKLRVFTFIVLASLPAQAAVGVRLLLGVTDSESAKWDGSVAAKGARITSIEPWRFDTGDALLSAGS